MNLEILDCTIRDGGYCNNWNFEDRLVRDVYQAVTFSGVDIMEVGFRTSKGYFDEKTYGKWRFSKDEDIREVLEGIKGVKVSLMIDFGSIKIEDIDERANSPVFMYRVATHKNKIKEALELLGEIKDKGYDTSIQMMGYSTFSVEDQMQAMKHLEDYPIDYVYVADSFGSLLPDQIENIFAPLLEIPGIKIGFHSHNSLQMAFANTLEAIRCGASIIDGSIYGMGRGSGNLPLETIVSYLQLKYPEQFNVIPILHTIERYFLKLKETLGWGYQLPYFMSGLFNTHPYYAKNLIELHEYPIEDIWTALEIIKDLNPIGYSDKILQKIRNYGLIGKDSVFRANTDEVIEYERCVPSYVNKFKGRDFLVLANGPSLKKYKILIDQFIEKYNPVILGANYLGDLFLPDYHAFTNKIRFMEYVNTVNSRSRLFIGQNITEEMIRRYTDRNYETLCYNNVLSMDFDIKDDIIQSNCKTVSVLLCGIAIVMGAKRIFAAGLDGYKGTDETFDATHFYKEKDEPTNLKMLMEKHQWCEHFLNQIDEFLKTRNMEGIHIITPTGYRKFYTSIEKCIKRN